MTTPYQAIVQRTTGRVTDVLVCDQATADLFAQWDLYPGCDWHDVTALVPRPAPGWTYDRGRLLAFRPTQPGADWTWNDEADRWDAPPPPDSEAGASTDPDPSTDGSSSGRDQLPPTPTDGARTATEET